jgi:hypothetical protein
VVGSLSRRLAFLYHNFLGLLLSYHAQLPDYLVPLLGFLDPFLGFLSEAGTGETAAGVEYKRWPYAPLFHGGNISLVGQEVYIEDNQWPCGLPYQTSR